MKQKSQNLAKEPNRTLSEVAVVQTDKVPHFHLFEAMVVHWKTTLRHRIPQPDNDSLENQLRQSA